MRCFQKNFPEPIGLYDPRYERDSCGVGFVANIGGKPSHDILLKGIECVVHLTHRGAIDADAKTGDGAGVMTQIPRRFFERELQKLGHRNELVEDLACGMIFFPQDYGARERTRTIVDNRISRFGLRVIGWRRVPIDASILGDKAAQTMPGIEQILITKTGRISSPDDYERKLYLARKAIEKKIDREGIDDFYIASLSHRTMVYKGLLVAPQLKRFYLDLADPLYETAFTMFHQRYSTNTFPNWFLAQPFRMLAHNGEINTLQGNINWMRAREAEFESRVWNKEIKLLKPVIAAGGSDSACLDNVMELLVRSGREPLHTSMMLIPEAWENMPHMDSVLKAFYQYHACLSEPWDGPAAVAFSDGRILGAILDRNGLRPARYIVTADGMIVMGSEVGMLEMDEANVLEKGRLGPGQMIAIDLEHGILHKNDEIKNKLARSRPYSDWLKKQLRTVNAENGEKVYLPISSAHLTRLMLAFGFIQEELAFIVKPMVIDGKDPVGSMGDDTPLSVLSEKPRILATYFKQRFAQVTNPAVDPIREALVMSLHTLLGRRHNLLSEKEEHAKLIQLADFFLFNEELSALKQLEDLEFKSVTLDVNFDATQGPEALEQAVYDLCDRAQKAVDQGNTIVILSDRQIDERHAPIPMLLACGAVHHHLIRGGRRMRASLVLETGEPREIHHFAALLGYGADAINPYLALALVENFVAQGEAKGLSVREAYQNYRKAACDGVLKIMSKMGISTVSSYRGAQIFEAIGLSRSLVEQCFTGTPTGVSGIGYTQIARDVLRCHEKAFALESRLEVGGYYRHRTDGERHAFNPQVVKALQTAAETGSWEDYQTYRQLVNRREPIALRDLMKFKKCEPIPIEEVEPAENILSRLCTPGISYGALSLETHATLAIAMNRIGGKSNSGEGGEDPRRYKRRPNGDWPNSQIKQVASARFGVTPEYLMSATEFEIKIAQGSKPGEGGQLPGHKVSLEIAKVRHAVPGITLISPAPHHDIYSIEDIAQLIYDLKRINPQAKVCVKLVAEAGVGTVAAGVAKGHADIVQISGHDGGTGASPMSSIKHAGSAWELGLAETQQVLVLNDLRGRITVRTDGGFKTGRDVVIAGILGAEEFGFGTAALVAVGCCMVRQCHLNTCPVGVATQNEKLRLKFRGTPEALIHFFTHVAQEVREILAFLGARRFNDIIGRTELLEPIELDSSSKASHIDLCAILTQPDPHGTRPRHHIQERNDWDDVPMDEAILKDVQNAIETKTPVRIKCSIRNIHRTVGARIAGAIAVRYGDQGLPDGTIEMTCEGTAGQSFGAFLIRGMRMILVGQANDYVGKGMAGGELVLRPDPRAAFASEQNVILGNTVMYGATGGTLYAAGRAGERFCVRNSGGRAVVEGAGDHCCEYMTGGVVVILGETGRNFGAGMTGGAAYVLDEEGTFDQRYNSQLVGIERLTQSGDLELVKAMIERHIAYTESAHARRILGGWGKFESLFWKVKPRPTETKIRTEVVVNVNKDEYGRVIPTRELLKRTKA
ncbi:MAG: glutamate synthase subunit alpha [Omnitrophica bacterium RIFCSPLOWO2_12_FULL_50_11]|nr:MAG: glutamate synthase subunit alpha [Omnitrophica bacterium RIFCSPLOWO2_12_FULL_50_11]